MKEQTLTIESSLEARFAALFVQTASKFKSSIYVIIDNKTVNAKSIMGIISLGMLDGQSIKITATGEDEDEAIEVLSKFLSA